MWRELVRNYFFNADPDETVSDVLFIERYCSERTVANMQRNKVKPFALRKVLNQLSSLAPSLAQSTPGWSFQNANMLLVTFGTAHLQWRHDRKQKQQFYPVQVLRRPRFGICGIDSELYLWTDKSFIFDKNSNPYFGGFRAVDWPDWPGRSDGQCYFSTPLADSSGEFNFNLLAEGQPLRYLLQEIEDHANSNTFILDEILTQQRAFLGLPEEFSVIYPKLFSKNLTRTQKIKSVVKLPPRLKAVPEPVASNDWVELVETRVDELGMARENDQQELVDVPGIAGRYYVYALVDPTNENTPFYIGKGFHDRIHQHFRAIKTNSQHDINNENDSETETNSTKFKIGENSTAIMDAELPENSLVVSQLAEDAAKIDKIKDLLKAGVPRNQMARVIARGVSEAAAFAIEALLIKSIYGLNRLTNMVRGQHDERFRAIEDWSYQAGYDLPADQNGEFLADNKSHKLGSFYVYVLRDPDTKDIFYVGKGKGNRLCQHFYDARTHATPGIDRLDRLRQLLDRFKPNEIGRIIARVDSEALAFIIESFYIKFVVGFRHITNIQPGHLSGMFRSHGDWETRHGFDLPVEAGGLRRHLRDIFLGEGLDLLLQEIVQYPDLKIMLTQIKNPILKDAGELAVLASMQHVDVSVQLQIHVRCARRIQLCLIPVGEAGKDWIRKNFGRFNLYPIRRADDRFIAECWAGASNLTSDPVTAAIRAIKLVKLAQTLQAAIDKSDLEEFSDLLTGLPKI